MCIASFVSPVYSVCYVRFSVRCGPFIVVVARLIRCTGSFVELYQNNLNLFEYTIVYFNYLNLYLDQTKHYPITYFCGLQRLILIFQPHPKSKRE